jgi:uncharacterized repeat protein (TIGR01451 family)
MAGGTGLAVTLALVLLTATTVPARALGTAVGAADPASLSMTASVSPSTLVAGSPALYTVTVRNAGNAAASNVTTILPFDPANTLSIGTPLPAACTAAGQTVTCAQTSIPAGGAATYQIPVTVLSSVSDGTNIALRATATATGIPAASTTLISVAITRVDVEITKTGPATVAPGGGITYTITVTNHGPSDAATVTWHDPTNGNLVTIDSYPCGNTGLTVSCSVGTMTPGQTKTFTVPVTVNATLAPGTVIPDCATVYTGSPDTNPDNNQSCVDTTVGPVTPPVSRIEIVKTGPATITEGGTINYSVTVTNHGPDPATNVVVTDPVDAPFDSISSLPGDCALQDITITCQASTLAVNQSRTFSYAVSLSASVAAGTQITNCAAVTSKNDHVVQNPNPSCVQTDVVRVPTASVSIDKTGPAEARQGDTVAYALKVTNGGPDVAASVVVTDPTDPSLVTVISAPGCAVAAGTVTCQAGTLAAGDSRVFTVTVRVNPGLAANTVIVNCANVSTGTFNPDTGDSQSCVHTVITPTIPVADVEVVKTGPATAHAGETVQYSVAVTNHGPDPATDVIVSDPLDPALTAASLPGACDLSGGTVVCAAGTLAVGQTKTFTFTATVAAGTPVGTQIPNCAQASSESTILNPREEPACVETAVVPAQTARVTILKGGPAAVDPGGTITYTITVVNSGPDAAANVVITDPTDPSLITVTSAPGCTVAAGTVTCQAGTLPAGSVASFTVTAKLNPGVQGLVIENCAQVYTGTFDPNPGNNQSCVSTTVGLPVPPVSHLEVVKDAPVTAHAGGTIDYTVTVTNHGPDPAANVIVTDPLDALVTVTSLPGNCIQNGTTVLCLAGHLAVGESKTIAFTVIVTTAAKPGTRITDCAFATSNLTVLLRAGEPCVQTVVLPTPTALISIAKAGPGRVTPGAAATYTLTASNRGPRDAANVIVEDPTDPSLVTVTSVPGDCAVSAGTVTCQLGTLHAGETRHLTVKVKVRHGLRDGTVIGNCADIYSATADPDLDDNQSCLSTSVAVPPPPVARLMVDKDGPATAHAGGIIAYTITVTNRGPAIALIVIVRDPIDESRVTVASLPPDCALKGGTVTCRAGTLKPGQATAFRFTVMVHGDVRPGTRIDNCASASSDHTVLASGNARPIALIGGRSRQLPASPGSCTQAVIVARPGPPPVPVTG